MSFHTAQTFTFGEQPSASKWQYIWDNDYALQDWSAFTNATFPIALMADASITAAKLATNAATQNDGWISTALTLTYASASTVTVAGDQTTIFTKGTRVKFTQTTVKYYTVVSSSYSSPNTTITFAVNTDYTVANAAISAISYSYCANPQGYPILFTTSATEKIFIMGNKMTKIGTGTIVANGSASGAATTVTYNTAFASILSVMTGGMASGSLAGNVAGKTIGICDQIGTSSFRSVIQTGDGTNVPAATYYFTWMATGTI